MTWGQYNLFLVACGFVFGNSFARCLIIFNILYRQVYKLTCCEKFKYILLSIFVPFSFEFLEVLTMNIEIIEDFPV